MNETVSLSPAQSRLFRSWIVRIVSAQFKAGPNPRWTQRDCVGLIRFAVAESFQTHDARWRHANALAWSPLPPEIVLTDNQKRLRHNWKRSDGSRSAYVSAIELIQSNTRYLGKEINSINPGDLLFFDQGEIQHLMIWMGNFIAYHTGTITPTDNGLRSIRYEDLTRWNDSRWHPVAENSNFAGFYRLDFLTA